MKTMKSKIVFAMAILVAVGFCRMNASAQEGPPPKKEIVKEEKIIRKGGAPHQREPQIPNLSEEQKKKIKEIRMKEKKETLQMKNQLNEKSAHLKTLNSSDKPDLNEINKTVDEMMSLKGAMLKKQLNAKQEIRALLNDEQRLVFDTMREDRKRGKPMPPRHPEE